MLKVSDKPAAFSPPSQAIRTKEEQARIHKAVENLRGWGKRHGIKGNPLRDALMEDRRIHRAYAKGEIGKNMSDAEAFLEYRRRLRGHPSRKK